MGHREEAEALISSVDYSIEQDELDDEGAASLATAHAVLALLDYLQQDDTFEATQPPGSYGAYQASRIAQLEEELEATRAALRARENADAAEMKEAHEANAADLKLSEVEDRY